MLQLPGPAGNDFGAKQGQVDGDVRVHMVHLQKDLAGLDRDAQLLPALPDEGLFLRFACLHHAAHELPQKPPGLVSGALADHELAALHHQGGHHLHRHGYSLGSTSRMRAAMASSLWEGRMWAEMPFTASMAFSGQQGMSAA